MSAPKPNLIVIGHPAVAPGPAELDCCDCEKTFKVQQNTKDTVDRLGKNAPDLVCFFCYRRAEPFLKFLPTQVMGWKEGRKRLGLEDRT